jgi:hypothetical protein
MRASDPLGFPTIDQLLISLPVEQQLLKLKPNGSRIGGNRGIPTWSARGESRVGALRVVGEIAPRPGSRAGQPGPSPVVTLRVCSIRVSEGVESWPAET